MRPICARGSFSAPRVNPNAGTFVPILCQMPATEVVAIATGLSPPPATLVVAGLVFCPFCGLSGHCLSPLDCSKYTPRLSRCQIFSGKKFRQSDCKPGQDSDALMSSRVYWSAQAKAPRYSVEIARNSRRPSSGDGLGGGFLRYRFGFDDSQLGSSVDNQLDRLASSLDNLPTSQENVDARLIGIALDILESAA